MNIGVERSNADAQEPGHLRRGEIDRRPGGAFRGRRLHGLRNPHHAADVCELGGELVVGNGETVIHDFISDVLLRENRMVLAAYIG